MRIVVQLSPEAAVKARRSAGRDKHPSVLPWLEPPLRPVHESSSDPSLARFFSVEVDDSAEASRLVNRLNADPAVTAAYIKPDDELP